MRPASGFNLKTCCVRLTPPLLRVDVKAPATPATSLCTLATTCKKSAEACASERLLLSLGLTTGVACADESLVTPEVAAELCRLLLRGSLRERLNAINVLLPLMIYSPEVVSPATMDSVCVAAVTNAVVLTPEAEAADFSAEELRAALTNVEYRVVPSSAPPAVLRNAAETCLKLQCVYAFCNAMACPMSMDRPAEVAVALDRAFRMRLPEAVLALTQLGAGEDGSLPDLRRCVGFLSLGLVLAVADRAQPPPKQAQLDKVVADLRLSALAAVDPDARQAPRVRAAAVSALSRVVNAPADKAAALAAGALPWCTQMAADADTFSVEVRASALEVASTISYVATDVAKITPLLDFLRAHLVRVAVSPTLLDDPAVTAANEHSAVLLLYRVVHALTNLVHFHEVRPFFEESRVKGALPAIARAVASRPHAARLYRVLPDLIATLAVPATLALDGDLDRLVLYTVQPGAELPMSRSGMQHWPPVPPGPGQSLIVGAEGTPFVPPATFPCAACGAAAPRGQSFQRCAACRTVTYCGAACQRTHWKAHKADCKAAAAAQEMAKQAAGGLSASGRARRAGPSG